MTIQTLYNPLMISNLVIGSSPNYSSEQPILASSRDYGFDFEEDELASLPANPSTQSMPQVNVDEFESRYHWFIS